METRKRLYVFWGGLIIVFLLALLPRMLYPASRFMLWYERSIRFWDALLSGDLEGTYQQYHPGVTTMWIAGLGLRVYMWVKGCSSSQLLHPPKELAGPQSPPAQTAVVALALVIAACVVVIYIILVRLTNWPVAFCSAYLLALDPFHITHSKMIHVDGLLAVFMLISALSLTGYLQKKKWGYLAISGVFAGLAFLTKSPSWFLFPYAVLVVISYHLTNKNSTLADWSVIHTWRRRTWETVRILAVWGLVAGCVVFFLWPAMWTMPGKAFYRIAQAILYHAETSHSGLAFFAGQARQDLGPLYYIAAIGWKTTLITLPASCATILLMTRQTHRKNRYLWHMLLYTGAFLILMMFAAKKGSRYILPSIVGLDVLAGWGLVEVANGMGKWKRLQKQMRNPTVIIATALVIQAVIVLSHHPYYGTHHNLLLGGSQVAQYVLQMGDQGEGLDLAARFLNNQPGAARLAAEVIDENNLMFQSNFLGQTNLSGQVDYRVFSIHYEQRNVGSRTWNELRETCKQTPTWSVSFGGVPYAWICPAYPQSPTAFSIDQPLGVQLGGHIHLLGYSVNSSDLAPGETVKVTLFWQSDGKVTEDYHVFVHLLDAQGALVAQHDGIPAQGERPTWGWQEAEVLQDEHTLATETNLPNGEYTLSVGMYDYLTKVRLQAMSGNKHLPEDRVVLQAIEIRSP